MKMTDLFLNQLEREAASSRRTLERVPEGRNDWKPHPKSMPLGYLASLVATIPSWIAMMISQDEVDVNPPGGSRLRSPEFETTRGLVQALDDSVAKGRDALANTTDEHLAKPWRFMAGGRLVSELPRHIMLTDAVFSHWAHHRGQLTVYLRLNEAAVPAIYGPSADEGGF